MFGKRKKPKPTKLGVVPIVFYGGAFDGLEQIQTRVWIKRITNQDNQGRYSVRRCVQPGRYHIYKSLAAVDADTVDVVCMHHFATEVIEHESA